MGREILKVKKLLKSPKFENPNKQPTIDNFPLKTTSRGNNMSCHIRPSKRTDSNLKISLLEVLTR
jgi:hypothetical protein